MNLKYPGSVYQVAEPIKYQPVESTAAIFVNTYEGVLEMLAELKQAKEIAIDTEHHDFRTYSGLLSLMQISTRDKDWIVDTLQPWRHKLEVLNEVFADPSIIKVSNSWQAHCHAELTRTGSTWRLHGHHLAAARLRSLHRWLVRYISCRGHAGISGEKPCLSSEAIC